MGGSSCTVVGCGADSVVGKAVGVAGSSVAEGIAEPCPGRASADTVGVLPGAGAASPCPQAVSAKAATATVASSLRPGMLKFLPTDAAGSSAAGIIVVRGVGVGS